MIESSTNPTELYEDRSQYTSFPPKAIRLAVLATVSSALWTLQMPNLITIRPLKRIELPLPASGQDLHLSLSSGDSSTGNKFTISRSSFTGMVLLYCTIVVLFITPCWPPRSILNLLGTQKQTVRWHYLLRVAIGVPRFSLKVPRLSHFIESCFQLGEKVFPDRSGECVNDIDSIYRSHRKKGISIFKVWALCSIKSYSSNVS